MSENILKHAEFIGSTWLVELFQGYFEKFIVATEPHIIHQIKKMNLKRIFKPGNDEIALVQIVHVELNTLEKLRDCMLNLSPEINISNELLLKKQKKPLNTMLKLS